MMPGSLFSTQVQEHQKLLSALSRLSKNNPPSEDHALLEALDALAEVAKSWDRVVATHKSSSSASTTSREQRDVGNKISSSHKTKSKLAQLWYSTVSAVLAMNTTSGDQQSTASSSAAGSATSSSSSHCNKAFSATRTSTLSPVTKTRQHVAQCCWRIWRATTFLDFREATSAGCSFGELQLVAACKILNATANHGSDVFLRSHHFPDEAADHALDEGGAASKADGVGVPRHEAQIASKLLDLVRSFVDGGMNAAQAPDVQTGSTKAPSSLMKLPALWSSLFRLARNLACNAAPAVGEEMEDTTRQSASASSWSSSQRACAQQSHTVADGPDSSRSLRMEQDLLDVFHACCLAVYDSASCEKTVTALVSSIGSNIAIEPGRVLKEELATRLLLSLTSNCKPAVLHHRLCMCLALPPAQALRAHQRPHGFREHGGMNEASSKVLRLSAWDLLLLHEASSCAQMFETGTGTHSTSTSAAGLWARREVGQLTAEADGKTAPTVLHTAVRTTCEQTTITPELLHWFVLHRLDQVPTRKVCLLLEFADRLEVRETEDSMVDSNSQQKESNGTSRTSSVTTSIGVAKSHFLASIVEKVLAAQRDPHQTELRSGAGGGDVDVRVDHGEVNVGEGCTDELLRLSVEKFCQQTPTSLISQQHWCRVLHAVRRKVQSATTCAASTGGGAVVASAAVARTPLRGCSSPSKPGVFKNGTSSTSSGGDHLLPAPVASMLLSTLENYAERIDQIIPNVFEMKSTSLPEAVACAYLAVVTKGVLVCSHVAGTNSNAPAEVLALNSNEEAADRRTSSSEIQQECPRRGRAQASNTPTVDENGLLGAHVHAIEVIAAKYCESAYARNDESRGVSLGRALAFWKICNTDTSTGQLNPSLISLTSSDESCRPQQEFSFPPLYLVLRAHAALSIFAGVDLDPERAKSAESLAFRHCQEAFEGFLTRTGTPGVSAHGLENDGAEDEDQTKMRPHQEAEAVLQLVVTVLAFRWEDEDADVPTGAEKAKGDEDTAAPGGAEAVASSTKIATEDCRSSNTRRRSGMLQLCTEVAQEILRSTTSREEEKSSAFSRAEVGETSNCIKPQKMKTLPPRAAAAMLLARLGVQCSSLWEDVFALFGLPSWEAVRQTLEELEGQLQCMQGTHSSSKNICDEAPAHVVQIEMRSFAQDLVAGGKLDLAAVALLSALVSSDNQTQTSLTNGGAVVASTSTLLEALQTLVEFGRHNSRQEVSTELIVEDARRVGRIDMLPAPCSASSSGKCKTRRAVIEKAKSLLPKAVEHFSVDQQACALGAPPTGFDADTFENGLSLFRTLVAVLILEHDDDGGHRCERGGQPQSSSANPLTSTSALNQHSCYQKLSNLWEERATEAQSEAQLSHTILAFYLHELAKLATETCSFAAGLALNLQAMQEFAQAVPEMEEKVGSESIRDALSAKVSTFHSRLSKRFSLLGCELHFSIASGYEKAGLGKWAEHWHEAGKKFADSGDKVLLGQWQKRFQAACVGPRAPDVSADFLAAAGQQHTSVPVGHEDRPAADIFPVQLGLTPKGPALRLTEASAEKILCTLQTVSSEIKRVKLGCRVGRRSFPFLRGDYLSENSEQEHQNEIPQRLTRLAYEFLSAVDLLSLSGIRTAAISLTHFLHDVMEETDSTTSAHLEQHQEKIRTPAREPRVRAQCQLIIQSLAPFCASSLGSSILFDVRRLQRVLAASSAARRVPSWDKVIDRWFLNPNPKKSHADGAVDEASCLEHAEVYVHLAKFDAGRAGKDHSGEKLPAQEFLYLTRRQVLAQCAEGSGGSAGNVAEQNHVSAAAPASGTSSKTLGVCHRIPIAQEDSLIEKIDQLQTLLEQNRKSVKDLQKKIEDEDIFGDVAIEDTHAKERKEIEAEFWRDRREFDEKLKNWLQSFEAVVSSEVLESVFGKHERTDQERKTEEKATCRIVPSPTVFLYLDPNLANVPFEHLPTLRGRRISRALAPNILVAAMEKFQETLEASLNAKSPTKSLKRAREVGQAVRVVSAERNGNGGRSGQASLPQQESEVTSEQHSRRALKIRRTNRSGTDRQKDFCFSSDEGDGDSLSRQLEDRDNDEDGAEMKNDSAKNLPNPIESSDSPPRPMACSPDKPADQLSAPRHHQPHRSPASGVRAPTARFRDAQVSSFRVFEEDDVDHDQLMSRSGMKLKANAPVVSERISAKLQLQHQNTKLQTASSSTSVVDSGFFVLNPTNDVGLVHDKSLLPVLRQLRWKGVIGKTPSRKKLFQLMLERETFLFSGHYGGEQFVNAEQLELGLRTEVGEVLADNKNEHSGEQGQHAEAPAEDSFSLSAVKVKLKENTTENAARDMNLEEFVSSKLASSMLMGCSSTRHFMHGLKTARATRTNLFVTPPTAVASARGGPGELCTGRTTRRPAQTEVATSSSTAPAPLDSFEQEALSCATSGVSRPGLTAMKPQQLPTPVDSFGTHCHYLIGGSPFVVGCLWEVLNGEVDKFTARVLQDWKFSGTRKNGTSRTSCSSSASSDLLACLERSRSKCKLEFLTGCAVVHYGIPV
ncbi:unnamed protein product [Amoebophrya sp. A120]|nr:unnamed protein product [Amoebophrya sp. A120]|eukprot:GSA120T00005853001.1